MAANDSEGVFGGDGSVKWVVDGGNVKAGTPQSHPNGKGHHQEGISETADGERFKITIKLPKEANDPFLSELRAAINNPQGGKVSFTLPIEKENYDQIRIGWSSDDTSKP